jgi:LuxR family quorum sensing-dependent transcriptional regulator
MSLGAEERDLLRARIDLVVRRDIARRDRALGRISNDIVSAKNLLSRRQRETLQLMSRGLTYNQTAAELGLGIETVKQHMKDARRKLDAVNTNHAIGEAIRMGLIE